MEPSAGILLIADPFLKDPNFMRTVVFVLEHQSEGTFGFVLNRSYEYTLDQLVSEADGMKIPVFYGGPVQVDTIHFLHQYPDLIPGSFKVIDGVYWGGEFGTAIDLLKNGEIEASKIRFFIGYSGWSEGQLKDEMEGKSWMAADAKLSLVFHKDAGEIWKDSLRHLGGNYEMMINFPIDPSLN